MLTLGGVNLALVALDLLSRRLHRLGAIAESRFQQAQLNAGFIQARINPVSERDFPPLSMNRGTAPVSDRIVASQASSSPLAVVTVNMVIPAYGDSTDIAKLEAALERDAREPPICCSKATWIEFEYWPWYGKVFVFPLLTIGRVPLFFYVVHWYVLGAGSMFFHAIGDGLYMPYVVIWWFGLIVVMFCICAPYAKFKDKKGVESLWRFL